MTDASSLRMALRGDIERSGYYPALVSDALETALAGEPLVAYVVHHEATSRARRQKLPATRNAAT